MAPVINMVAFGRRCIPPQAALGIVRVGSNTAGMLPPRASGLVDLAVQPATDDAGNDPFGVLSAVGTKPREQAND